ncbi:aminotransferase class I/II-fold pyridoxal phosphate-dependent enzyme [Flavobacterium sp.]|uniref:aminotransferase class I/II-fold pyridoxal phosphate-dependent enzyme n=1 Tax=Flavobacterium sp. TaxID=239 RepID=UPI00286EFEA0|nr:aminotransferase class I/II-fold pyridoxal phosphate-dependent enzyme [Flavobacterium sp.]
MINLFEPNIGTQSSESLSQVFTSKWLGRGDFVNSFEEKLTKFMKIDSNFHTISSCSDAIIGSFELFDFKIDDEIIMPTNSFPVISSGAILKGLKPVIVDIDPSTGNIDFESCRKALSTRTKAIYITHYGGIPVDIKKLKEYIGNDIIILEDSACALGTFVDNQSVGSNGDFSCWSFDAMKLLVCGEGGAFHIKDSERFERACEFFYLGLPKNKKSGMDSAKDNANWWEYDLKRIGIRSIFTNINAAIGLPELERLNFYLERKSEIASKYDNNLRAELITHRNDLLKDNVTYSNYFYTIKTDKRDELAKYLLEKKIYTSLRYSPLHKMNLFQKYAVGDFFGADDFYSRSLNIPIHQFLKDGDAEYIIDSINSFY